MFDSWIRKIPWRRKWQSTPALLPGKSHGRRSLIGYSPWGRKESTRLSNFTFTFTAGSVVKNPSTSVGDADLIFGLGRSPGEENGNLLQYSCLKNPIEWRSLVGYSPWGCKESDTTERLHSLTQSKYFGKSHVTF